MAQTLSFEGNPQVSLPIMVDEKETRVTVSIPRDHKGSIGLLGEIASKQGKHTLGGNFTRDSQPAAHVRRPEAGTERRRHAREIGDAVATVALHEIGGSEYTRSQIILSRTLLNQGRVALGLEAEPPRPDELEAFTPVQTSPAPPKPQSRVMALMGMLGRVF